MGAIDLFDARYDPWAIANNTPPGGTAGGTVLYTNYPSRTFMSWPHGTRDRDRVWADRIKEFFTSTAQHAMLPPQRHDRRPHCAAQQSRPRVQARRVPTRLPRDAKGRVGWRRTRRAA